MKVNLRKEGIEILYILKDMNAYNLINAVTIKEIKLKLEERESLYSLQFIKKYIKIFENMLMIREGLLARKNAKTYYLDLEVMDKFINKVHEKYDK